MTKSRPIPARPVTSRGLPSLLFFLGLCALAAASGAFFEPGQWYARLEKPPFTPPDAAFPIAWTILYLAIGWAGWRFWRAGGWSPVLGLWATQLILNAAWSWLFFGLHETGWAFLEIAVLWLAILATMALGWRLDRSASLVLGPYLLWVAFAGWLNVQVWLRNP